MNRFFPVALSLSALAAGVLVHGQQGTAQTPSPFPLSNSVRERGSSVTGAYEGWYYNKDGSISLLLGYFNRNTKQEFDLPPGPNNRIEPGGPDQGQPTHFLPRRNRFLVRIRVPKDFGNKEVVWTLTSRGKTTRAYATLKPDYFVDDLVIMNNNGAGGPGGGSPDTHGNKAPKLEVVDGQKSRRVIALGRFFLQTFETDRFQIARHARL